MKARRAGVEGGDDLRNEHGDGKTIYAIFRYAPEKEIVYDSGGSAEKRKPMAPISSFPSPYPLTDISSSTLALILISARPIP